MPNFITHWLVAIRSQDKVTKDIQNGYKIYLALAKELCILLDKSKKDSKTISIISDLFRKKVKENSAYDDMTCFSAYMLGACGPDFWTLPTDSGKVVPDTAGIHFDLGHYNRTHAQFICFLKDVVWWREAKLPWLDQKVRLAYFLGMASHIATDLVVHQLVNVSAGAYNLLDHNWENEHGRDYTINLWTTHNKVEHYWDSYLRYRYFGNYGPVFRDHHGKPLDTEDWFQPLGFPLTETILTDMIESGRLHVGFGETLPAKIGRHLPHMDIEMCFNLPRIFCDRVVKTNEIKPFIYKYIVDKTFGAYPKESVFDQADAESKHSQFYNPTTKEHDETNKLSFFSTDLNKHPESGNLEDVPMCSHNFLTYFVCPRLKHLQKYGHNVFYDLGALKHFLSAAIQASRRFMDKLLDAFHEAENHSDPWEEHEPGIGCLGGFWNLDTGTGIEISNPTSDTANEVITKIKLNHIFESTGRLGLGYNLRNYDYLTGKPNATYSNPTNQPAFETYLPDKPHKNIFAVTESDPDKYLQSIRLEHPEDVPDTDMTIDDFFTNRSVNPYKTAICKTFSLIEKENVLVVHNLKSRLNLQIEAAIADLDFGEELGFYFLGDDQPKTTDGVKHKEANIPIVQYQKIEKRCRQWLTNHKKIAPHTSQCLDFITAQQDQNRLETNGVLRFERDELGLGRFYTNYFINLDKNIKAERKLGDAWNNVIDFNRHKTHYGRNYAIATGRRFVLKPKGDGNFWADSDFGTYQNVSPTDHIFITLIALVKSGNDCYDLISKEPVDKNTLDALTKIECSGFVKIILFYTLGGKGALQVDQCYIDGMRIEVG